MANLDRLEAVIREAPAHHSGAPGGVVLKRARVVAIDHDRGFLTVLENRLRRLEAELIVVERPVAVEALTALRPSAVVVDPTLFEGQGIAWLERLHTTLPLLPALVCTAPVSVAERVRGLRAGADDWIAKPCHPEEVVARLEAVLRRKGEGGSQREAEPLRAGELEIRPDRYQAYVRGVSLDLTRREYELLELLASANGRVLEREEIYSRLWGYVMVRGDRSVDVFVRKVRQKLRAASPGWRYIHTHFGVGYRFAAEPLAEFQPGPPTRSQERAKITS